MKHLSFLRRHANIVFCLLLCLVYQRAESKELFENNSLDTCYVLAIANVDLTTDLQKKYEERNIATSAIVGYSFSDDEVKIYLLDDRYDFDLYSIQKGDSITLHYPHTSQEKEKKAIAIHNHSFQERIRKNDSIYIDIDFWNIEKKLSLPPSLDDGLFLKWEIAKRRFIKHIVKDSQGFHKLDVENEDDLRLSKRTFGQLYCMYILVEKARVNCFAGDRLCSEEAAWAYMQYSPKDMLRYAVSLKKDDFIIGDVFALRENEDTYNVGWHFNKRFEGKGFACEAAAGLLDYLFREAGARRIYGFVEDDNIRSERLCERLGMRREGCFKEFVTFVNNPDGSPKYEDTCVYAILEKEWNTIRQW